MDSASTAATAATAADAYVSGYSLVVTTRTMQLLGGFFGVNQLSWQRALAGPRSRVIVAPNRDTLYSSAVLDLRAEPMVLTLPEVADRYFSYQLLDAWTESFAYVGTRTHRGRAGRWVVVPPGWEGELPEDVERIDAPTPQVFLLGRFLADDRADVAAVLAIAERTGLEPLSTVMGLPSPPPPPPLGAALGPAQAVPHDASFFPELAAALAVNPPTTAEDRRRFAALAELGVDLAQLVDLAALETHLVTMLDEGAARGSLEVDRLRDGRAEVVNGWAVNRHVGTYGDDVLLRALVARIGWGANVPDEALYPLTRTDADGQPLEGTATYRLRFPPGGLPPVGAFWSLCAYGDDLFFTEHASGRYHIGDRTPHLVVADDGSAEIVLSHHRPDGADEAVGWLPVPEGRFRLMLRLYLPGDAVLDGTYRYPPVERT
jgi:hypothetical protein